MLGEKGRVYRFLILSAVYVFLNIFITFLKLVKMIILNRFNYINCTLRLEIALGERITDVHNL